MTAFLNDIQSTVLPVGRSQILVGIQCGNCETIDIRTREHSAETGITSQ